MTTTLTPSRLERARTLDGRLRSIASRNAIGEVEAATALDTLDSSKLYDELCYASTVAYSYEVFHYGADKTRTLLKIVRSSSAALRASFETGSLPWTKARELLKVITDANAAEWLEKAAELNVTQLQRAVAKALGKEVPQVLTRRVTAEERVELENLEVHMREQGFETWGAAMAEAARRVMAGTCEGIEPAVVVTVFDHCANCGQTTREGLDGPVPVLPVALEQALCHAEVVDWRRGEVKLARAIPSRILKVVKARDKGRCQVPRCRQRAWVQLHHEGGWKNTGHDPDVIVSLCRSHHGQRHTGKLLIEIDRPVVRFRRADKTLIGEVRTGESPMEVPREDPAGQSPPPPPPPPPPPAPPPPPSSSSSSAAA
jgi:hypothetical protein